MAFYSLSGQPGDIIRYFPYIGDDSRLHLWNIDRGENIIVRQRNGFLPDGFEAHEVRRRWPAIFELAQKEGLWT